LRVYLLEPYLQHTDPFRMRVHYDAVRLLLWAVLPILYLKFVDKALRSLLPQAQIPPAALYGTILAVGSGLGAIALGLILSMVKDKLYLEFSSPIDWKPFLLFLVMVPIAEEIMFRGFVLLEAADMAPFRFGQPDADIALRAGSCSRLDSKQRPGCHDGSTVSFRLFSWPRTGLYGQKIQLPIPQHPGARLSIISSLPSWFKYSLVT
jgi:hypothetical protein